MKKINNFFKNKNILLTGGTGTFGQNFIQFLIEHTKPRKIVIYSRDEYKQFNLQEKFKKNSDIMRFLIGDVRDSDRLNFATTDIDIILHAAALKQVPAAEYNPLECVKTNINGAENVIQAAIKNEVQHTIALSTDKASSPINLYGATKLVSDKIFVNANNMKGRRNCHFSVVRYGNVVDSRGSVIPFFKKLKDDQAKLFPVTDINMTRFVISINQAVNFVTKCFLLMKGGEIFIPKIPSIRITDLVKAIDKKAQIKIIGTRPGEKIHEEQIPYGLHKNVLEFKDYYLLLPRTVEELSSSKIDFFGQTGKKVKDNFSYNSKENKYLNINQIEQIIK